MFTDNFKPRLGINHNGFLYSYYEVCEKKMPDLQTELILGKNDNIYIYPKSIVPRFKLESLKKKIGFTVTNNPAKATKHLVGDNYLDSLKTDRVWLVDKDKYVKEIDIQKRNGDGQYQNYVKIINTLSTVTDHVIVAHSNPGKVDNYRINRIEYTKAGIDEVTKYSEFLDTPPHKLFKDSSILPLLNNNKVMYETDYNRLCNMFQSSDKKDIDLAIELMSNFDYTHSASYILLLIYYYKDKIKNSNLNHAVNFKSLKSFYKFDSVDYMNVDKMINILMNCNLYTSYHSNIIMNDYKNTLSYHNHYIVDKLTLSEQGLNSLVKTDDDTVIIEDDENLNMSI